MSGALPFCTFEVGDLWLGIEVLEVQEVIRWHPLTRVPLAPRAVSGLMNLRGQIVTAVDLRRRFGLSGRTGSALPMNVVVRAPDGPVSLLVDEVGDVVEVSDDAFEPPPDTVSADVRVLIKGVYKTAGRLLLALNTEEVLEVGAIAIRGGMQ